MSVSCNDMMQACIGSSTWYEKVPQKGDEGISVGGETTKKTVGVWGVRGYLGVPIQWPA